MLELAPPLAEDPRFPAPALGLRKDFAAAAAAAAAADGLQGEGGTLLLLLIPWCRISDGTEGVVDGGRPP